MTERRRRRGAKRSESRARTPRRIWSSRAAEASCSSIAPLSARPGPPRVTEGSSRRGATASTTPAWLFGNPAVLAHASPRTDQKRIVGRVPHPRPDRIQHRRQSFPPSAVSCIALSRMRNVCSDCAPFSDTVPFALSDHLFDPPYPSHLGALPALVLVMPAGRWTGPRKEGFRGSAAAGNTPRCQGSTAPGSGPPRRSCGPRPVCLRGERGSRSGDGEGGGSVSRRARGVDCLACPTTPPAPTR